MFKEGIGAADLLTAITELDYYEFGGNVHLRQYGLVELDPGDGSGSRAAGDTGRNIQAQYERGTDLNLLARYDMAQRQVTGSAGNDDDIAYSAQANI